MKLKNCFSESYLVRLASARERERVDPWRVHPKRSSYNGTLARKMVISSAHSRFWLGHYIYAKNESFFLLTNSKNNGFCFIYLIEEKPSSYPSSNFLFSSTIQFASLCRSIAFLLLAQKQNVTKEVKCGR
mmetsp:Transcript_30010/g.45512  ORF Transcript_30010/g.45512 Transcript_30010/m.45512 type:complete len:130 (-) Transcript_30010:1005-1394(-)